MTISRLEALVDAISSINGSKAPDSPAYQARNPLCLQVFTEQGVCTNRLRRFPSLHGGYLAALYDLKIKCSGKSRAKLAGENFTLRGLMRVYNLPDASAGYVVSFLKKALSDQEISATTRLDYFLSARAES